MASPELPSFDLVVATVGRTTEVERLLDSLGRQTHRRFRVLLVDQNEDDELAALIARRSDDDIVHLRSAPPGLSRARNRGLREVTADVVAFPDDDCEYDPELLERVARRLAEDDTLDGVSGRSVGRDGRASASWEREPALLTDDNLWNRVNSAAIFLRRAVVERVGEFDERLGLGSGEPWSSGEEVDYLVRAVRSGARVVYDPELTVTHDERQLDASGRQALRARDGASVGYVLHKHGYPGRVRARMLVRPLGGTLLAVLRLDRDRAALHAATLRGRLRGLRARTP